MMRPLLACGPRGHAHEKLLGFSQVSGELDWLRSANILIDFRSGHDAGRPLPWRVECQPFDDRPAEQAACVAGALVSERHSRTITEMTHHLVRVHAPPLPGTVGTRTP